MTNKVTKTAPERIWLQVSGERYDNHHPFPCDSEPVTWCDEHIYECEVEYIRADLVRAAMPVNWRDDSKMRKLGKMLDIK